MAQAFVKLCIKKRDMETSIDNLQSCRLTHMNIQQKNRNTWTII